MPYDRYSGAWARRSETPEQVPLKPAIDPQHLTPEPTPEFTGMTPLWVNSAGAPLLPSEIEAATRAKSLPTGDGPVDNTPESHFYGRGTGPGLTTLQAQDVMAPWHEDDQGTVAANAYVAMVDRDDAPGSPHADLTFSDPGNGASPESVRMLETGVGAPYDKGLSREGRWFRRWRDRHIDMHRYPVDLRPLTPKVAFVAPAQPAMADPTQLDSPYATAATNHMGPRDTFVQQVVRRAPRNWADPLSTDGSRDESGPAAQSYGLRTYGL
jgi:hypothetical protein